ncbi:MAG: redoxin family protein [Pirellulaceae bacterium]
MTNRVIRLTPATRVFVVASCSTAIVFSNGCGSGDRAAESGKPKYEVAGDDRGMAGGAGVLPRTPEPGSLDPSRPSTSPSARGPSGGSPGAYAAGAMPAGDTPRQPPSTPPGGLNPYQVQGETPEELVAFIQSIMQSAQRPKGATRAEQISNLQNILATVIAAADKILGQQADGDAQRMAAEAKVAGLTQMAELGVGDAQQRLIAFCDELEKSDNMDLAQLGKRIGFASAMDVFAQGEDEDAAALVERFKGLFANETKDQRTFLFGNSVVSVFEQRGFKAEAVDVLTTVGAAFAESSEPQLAAAVIQLKERAQLIEVGLRDKLSAYMLGQEGALKPLLDGLDTLLQGAERGKMTMSVAREVATYLEPQDPDHAGEVYKKLAEAYKNDPELAKEVEAATEKFTKRSTIVGQPFVVEGANLDGSPFDWSRYAGKVVLVDFWATWCQPCLVEIPHIKENYDRYRDQGFEVVSVNLDDQRSRLDQFLAVQPLPWPIVVSADANAVGFNTPLAAKCGIEAIPFLVLVDRGGTAIALNLRGDQLSSKLAELFPEKPAP